MNAATAGVYRLNRVVGKLTKRLNRQIGQFGKLNLMLDNTVQVLPLNDLKPHIENGHWCHCAPQIKDVNGGYVIVHNAYDGREFYEQDEAGNTDCF